MFVRRLLLVALVVICGVRVIDARAAAEVHYSCPTLANTGGFGSIYFAPAKCSNFTGVPYGVVIQACEAMQVSAFNAGGGVQACTALKDDVTTAGAGHLYLSCPTCRKYEDDGVTRRGIDYMLIGATTENPTTYSCTLTSSPVANTFICGTRRIVACLNDGNIRPCSLGKTREVDVGELTNITIMGWALFALIAGLIFGWKIVQRGTSQ